MEPLMFDTLDLVEVPVTIGQRNFILREGNEDAVRQWRNAVLRGAKVSQDGKVLAAEGVGDADSVLLSLCLWEKLDKGGLRQVSQTEVRKFPRRIVEKLVNAVKDLTGIREDETEEVLRKRIEADQAKLAKLENSDAKNSLGAIGITSE